MEKLKRLIGLAPSEMSHEELVNFVKKRQAFVAGMLQEFRDRMARGKGPIKKGRTTVTESTFELKGFLEQLKELGMTMEEFKRAMKGAKK